MDNKSPHVVIIIKGNDTTLPVAVKQKSTLYDRFMSIKRYFSKCSIQDHDPVLDSLEKGQSNNTTKA
uniref:Uncharacterized protein n=1 Tax=viral metagenome TaxID=1070528 RepID=A0A6C0EAN1_9ZZZZ